jgi:hypothetical protein
MNFRIVVFALLCASGCFWAGVAWKAELDHKLEQKPWTLETKVPHPPWLKACSNDKLGEMLQLLGRSQIHQGLGADEFIELTKTFRPRLLRGEDHLTFWPTDRQGRRSYLLSLRTEIDPTSAPLYSYPFESLELQQPTSVPVPLRQVPEDVQSPVREWLLVVRFAEVTNSLIDWKIMIGGKTLGE